MQVKWAGEPIFSQIPSSKTQGKLIVGSKRRGAVSTDPTDCPRVFDDDRGPTVLRNVF